MRITNRMLSDQAVLELSRQLEAAAHAQDQVVSGKQIVKPSDDPAGTRSAIRLRDALDATGQYLRNIDLAGQNYSAADTALGESSDVLLRARELAVEGGDGSLTAGDRSAIALEVEQIARNLVQLAGAKAGDRYVFSGYQTNLPPFTEAPAGSAAVSAYQGDAGALLSRIGPGSTVPTNVAGDAAFKPALDALAQLYTDLTTGTGAVQAGTIAMVDAGQDAISTARAQIGAWQNRVDHAQESLSAIQLSTTKLVSDLEDVDFTKAVTEMTARQTAYEAALKANANLLQRSLLDELR